VSSINPLTGANWDQSADDYDRFEKKWHYYARVAEGMLQRLSIGRESSVLELAAGTGACSELLSGICSKGEVVCVERSSEMSRILEANLTAAGRTNVEVLWGDVKNLHSLIAGRKFDAAVCNSAFWQFSQAELVASRVRHALRPGGVFAFNLPSLYSFGRERQELRSTVNKILLRHGVEVSAFWRERKRVDHIALMKRAGFEVVTDDHYYVRTRAREMSEWRNIPVFAKRWGNFADLPENVAKEIIDAVREKRRELWPKDEGRRSVWRVIVGRSTEP
jgi:ubiquinone/menaquinone biosynthesis C-methylase UbiE